jgi:hypothetical protein
MDKVTMIDPMDRDDGETEDVSEKVSHNRLTTPTFDRVAL